MEQAFLNAMARAANSVVVVTTDGPAGRAGVTVSAMCSVSVAAPAPTLLICVHEASPARRAIEANGLFCANLLSDSQHHISDCFAGRTGAAGADKFACATWHCLATGAPALDAALACFDCTLLDQSKIGTHHIFIGAIAGVECMAEGRPLVYHDRAYGRPQALEPA